MNGSNRRPYPAPPLIRRRTFLKGSLAAGAMLGLGPGLLKGCGTGDGGHAGTERRELHFDLSHIDGAEHHALVLHVAGARYALEPHTTATRERCKAASPTLREVPDARLTHHVGGVTLPSAALQLGHVTGTDARTGERDILCATALHLPTASLIPGPEAPSTTPQLGDDPLVDLDSFVTPYDAARTFLFHHPDLMNLDPSVAAVVLEIVDRHLGAPDAKPCSENPSALVCEIAKQGPGKADSGWMRKVDLETADGVPVWLTEDASGETRMVTVEDDGTLLLVFDLSDDGTPRVLTDEEDPTARRRAFKYEPTQRTIDAARDTLREVLAEAMSDPRLEGVKWHVDEAGTLDVDGDSAAHHDPEALLTEPGEEVQTKVTLDRGGSRAFDIRLDTFSYEPVPGDSTYGTVDISIENKYLRHLAVYVQWLDANGGAIDPSPYVHELSALGRSGLWAPVYELLDTDASFCVARVGPNADLLSIPLPFTWTPISVPYLAEASACRIVVGSLGTGRKGDEVIGASVITGVVNLGLPAWFLASAIALNPASEKILQEAVEDPETYKGLIGMGAALTYSGVMDDLNDDSNQTAVGSLAKMVGPILVGQGLTKLRVAIVQVAAESAAIDAIPFVGWALWAADIAANASDLAQTIAEVSTTPARYENTIRFTWSPTFTITADPKNMAGVLPEEAASYVCTVKQKKKAFKTVRGAIPERELTQLAIQIKDLPLGGQATYAIELLDRSGGRVGYLAGKTVTNSPDPAHYPAEYTAAITELPAHIGAGTTYQHYDKIGFDAAGQHVWLGSGAAGQPTATVADLLCSDTELALCAPLALTLSQNAHCAGYVWRGSGLPREGCAGGEAAGGARYAAQNLSLRANDVEGGPEAFLVAPGCAYNLKQPALSYDLEGPVDGAHFVVEPKGTHEHHLRRLVLRPGELGFSGGPSWGLFISPPDDIAVHPGGFVASVNRIACQLELLELPAAPGPDEAALAAHLIAGPGTRLGLLGTPVAVSVTQDGTILVLEQETRRISAFDTGGRLVRAFGADPDARSSTLALKEEGAPVTYLDLEVSGPLTCASDGSGTVVPHGFLYVLSYVGEGRAVDDYRLDIYTACGAWLCRTVGLNAARIAVDHFRKIYALSYEAITGPSGMPEPSLSWWVPVG